MTTPALSILIPSHRPWYLSEAMGSVFNQTRKDLQLLVSYADPSEISFWPEKVNELSRAAKAPAVTTLADDDLLAPTFAEATLGKLAEGFDVVYTNWSRMRGDELRGWDAMPWVEESFRAGANPLCGMTYVVRTEWWNRVGGADPGQTFWDWATAYALFKAGATACHLEDRLVVFREHEDKEPMDYGAAVGKIHAKYPELRRAA